MNLASSDKASGNSRAARDSYRIVLSTLILAKLVRSGEFAKSFYLSIVSNYSNNEIHMHWLYVYISVLITMQ